MSKGIDVKYYNRWTGYKNYKNVVSLLPTDITAGSKNIMVLDGSELASRGGSSYFGAQGTIGVNTNTAWSLAHRIHSDYDLFVNSQGIKMPFRVFYSGTTAKGDVLETWLPEYIGGAAQTTKKWYQVTPNIPSTAINSTHRWYFAEWYDGLNVQNRIVFTYGVNTISSYSGGFAPVTATTATTITTNGTWKSKGFIDSPEGVASVVINGTIYAITSGDFSTNTITVASTTGISVNDVAFQSLNHDTATFGVADNCSTINNQVYYLDNNQRNCYISWNRNRVAFLGDTSYVGTSGLNDAVFAGTFTGTKTDTYLVTIDSTVQSPIFTGSGANGLTFNISGYTLPGVTNTYKVVIYQRKQTGTGYLLEYYYRIYKNDIEVVLNAGPLQGPSGPDYIPITGPFLVADGIYATIPSEIIGETLAFGTAGAVYTGSLQPGNTWEITVTSKADTFSWSLNGQNLGSLITITGAAQTLSQGVTVDFVNLTGHKVSDSWTMNAFQKVQKGWRDFIYTFPNRYPGEGFILQLSSNGWALKPQESEMYINGQAGEYYRVVEKLSSDLKSETISTIRLKSEPQKKALYPYLMTYNNNNLSIVSEELTWDILGRQKFMELPQVKSLSDTVKYDFYRTNWEDGNIRYLKRNQFFVAPNSGVIFVYDDFNKYWHAPQEFARTISSIGFIDGKIVGHSYERNETYELFTTDKNDLDIYPIKTNITTSYYDYGKRFTHKDTAAIAIDGFIDGTPEIRWTMNFGVGGCVAVETGIVDPLICYPTDTASLGKSSLGFHGLGNSPADVIPHYTFGKTFDNQNYYLRNVELSCESLNQRWSVVSLGQDVELNAVVNADIFNTESPY